jgi:hypothetical protein
MPGPSNASRTRGATTRFEVPIIPSGREGQPGQRPVQPLAVARHRRQREQRQRVARAHPQAQPPRAPQRPGPRPDHDAAPIGVAHQRVHHRKPVVQPRPGEAHRQHEGRRDQPQRLVEVGGVLFGDRVQPVGRQGPSRRGRDRIEVADHRLGPVAGGQQPVGPAVGRHCMGRAGQRRFRSRAGTGAPPTRVTPSRLIGQSAIHADTV